MVTGGPVAPQKSIRSVRDRAAVELRSLRRGRASVGGLRQACRCSAAIAPAAAQDVLLLGRARAAGPRRSVPSNHARTAPAHGLEMAFRPRKMTPSVCFPSSARSRRAVARDVGRRPRVRRLAARLVDARPRGFCTDPRQLPALGPMRREVGPPLGQQKPGRGRFSRAGLGTVNGDFRPLAPAGAAWELLRCRWWLARPG
jgi:hypothetical protein